MALPRARRVRRTSEFNAVRRQGASWTGRLLILAALPLPDEPHSRFGFTITRRIGNAVIRNKLRRRLASIADSQFPHLASPHLIVTIPRNNAVTADFETLKGEWIKLARRACLLTPTSPPPP
jgi:ribonuclease P protein component